MCSMPSISTARMRTCRPSSKLLTVSVRKKSHPFAGGITQRVSWLCQRTLPAARMTCYIVYVAAHKLIDAPEGLDPIEVRPSKDPKVHA